MPNTPTANSLLQKPAKGDLLWQTTANANWDAIDAYLIRRGQNILINGDFRINERNYISGVALAADAYAHDGWVAGASGGTYAFTQLVSPTTITIAANKSLKQIVPVEEVEGGSYTLSWTGSAVGRLVKNSSAVSGNFAVSPITVTGQTAGLNMVLELTGANAAGGSTIATNTGTAGKVKLEYGVTATAFVPELWSIALQRCQRWCNVWQAAGSFSIIGRADKEPDGLWRTYFSFKTRMREPVINNFNASAAGQFGIYNDRTNSNQATADPLQFIPIYGGGSGVNVEGCGITLSASGITESVGWMQAYNDASAYMIFNVGPL